jgi:hypothetical protein
VSSAFLHPAVRTLYGQQLTVCFCAAERVAAELAKDTAAVQLLQGRPDATISSGDVKPMESAAVNGMRKRAVLFMDAAQQPWTVMHANDLLAEVCLAYLHFTIIDAQSA